VRAVVQALINELLDGVPPERQTAKAVAATLAASKLWPKEYVFLQSWFEQSDAVSAIANAAGTKKQREGAVLQKYRSRASGAVG